ncbi:MAG: ROK family protein [Lentisphaerales bacterium]|nr:MAG: ROK family protein [Lentisphaerales bacterium]
MVANGKNEFRIGFDLGGTKMLALLFDKKFKVIARRRRKTKPEEGQESGLTRIVETIQQLLNEAGIGKKDLAAMGIAVPGPLDLDKGILLEAPNLGWKNVPLKKRLEAEFECQAVVSNDVDAGVYGEYLFGAGNKARCVLGVFPGTGIGGGCVYSGRILRGKTRSCVEIGHLQVVPNGQLCGCGLHGCLETVASRLAISSAAISAAARGEAPHLLETYGTDIADVRSGALADAIKAGDKAVEIIVKDAAAWLGIGVASGVSILAPDVVVLGGGLVEAMPTLIREEVERSARSHTMNTMRNSFRVVVAVLGDDATAVGAAAWAAKRAPAGKKDSK